MFVLKNLSFKSNFIEFPIGNYCYILFLSLAFLSITLIYFQNFYKLYKKNSENLYFYSYLLFKR